MSAAGLMGVLVDDRDLAQPASFWMVEAGQRMPLEGPRDIDGQLRQVRSGLVPPVHPRHKVDSSRTSLAVQMTTTVWREGLRRTGFLGEDRTTLLLGVESRVPPWSLGLPLRRPASVDVVEVGIVHPASANPRLTTLTVGPVGS